MTQERLIQALDLIDQANAEDPHRLNWQGVELPQALLYGQRMSLWLGRLQDSPSAARQLAARAQHIRRWTVPRENYPEGREGYLRWRKYLYGFHADQAEHIMRTVGYDETTIAAVRKMLGKQGIKHDPDVQIIEDVACLVFLEFYLADFAAKNDPAKLIAIIRKTWKKMSTEGQQAALNLSFPDRLHELVAQALAEPGQ